MGGLDRESRQVKPTIVDLRMEEIDSRVTYYKPQIEAYREPMGSTVGATMLFLHPEASHAVLV